MAEILVVDDDALIRNTLSELLSQQHQCQTAETAEIALAKLEAESFDVVLTDISMPGLSGLELLGHVLQKYPETPVIIISGISDQDHAGAEPPVGLRGQFPHRLVQVRVVDPSSGRGVRLRP